MSNHTDESTVAPSPGERGDADEPLDSTERLRRLRRQTAGAVADGPRVRVVAHASADPAQTTQTDPDHFRRLRAGQLDATRGAAPRVVPAPKPPAPRPNALVEPADEARPERSGPPEPEAPTTHLDVDPDVADEDEPDQDDSIEIDVLEQGGDSESPDGGPDGADEREDPDILGAAATVAVVKGRSGKRRTAKAERAKRRSGAEAAAVDPPRAEGTGHETVHVFEANHATKIRLGAYLKDLWFRRKFIAALAKSDIKGRRSSTSLGAVWGLLDPLFQSAIYFFVYIVIRGAGSGGSSGGRTVDFLPLLIGGVFLFRLFTAALSEGGKSVKRSTSLMLNASFPRALLPLASVYKGLIEFVPTLLIYGLVYAFLGVGLQWEGLLSLPLLFAIQVVLSAGVALGAATIVVFFPDFENMLRYIQRILFFTTPIIFPADRIPEGILPWLRLNPLFGLFNSYQTVLGGGLAARSDVIAASLWAVFFLVIGTWVFLHNERKMAARL